MTIRLRYQLSILPLFLGLGLINAGVFSFLNRQEALWGVAERTGGLAVAIANFWGVTAQGDAPTRGESPPPELVRLSERMGGLTISWFSPEGDTWPSTVLLQGDEIGAPPMPSPAEVMTLRGGRGVSRRRPQPERTNDENIGYAPVLDAAGGLRAIIAVTERDVLVRETMTRVKTRSLTLIAFLLLAAIVIVEVLTRMVRREVDALVRVSDQLARGEFDAAWQEGRIRELNDVGGTLRTMASLLDDAARRTRRQFLQAEGLPGPESIAAMSQDFGDMHGSDGSGVPAHVFRRLGRPPDDFFGSRATPEGAVLVTGRCIAPEGIGALERSIHAQAARDYLIAAFTKERPGEWWPDFHARFPCAVLQVVLVTHRHEAATLWSFPGPDGTLLTVHPPGSRLAFGTADAPLREFAQGYLDEFPDRSLEILSDEIAILLAGRDVGVIAICALPAAAARLESARGDELLELAAHGDEEFLAGLRARHRAGEPAAYVAGFFNFRGRRFRIDSRAYITDPEMTHLVDIVNAEGRGLARAIGRPLKVLEFGAGAGALAISVQLENPSWKVTGLDLSADALVLARQNSADHGVTLPFLESDLFSSWPAEAPAPDLIFGDPPWGGSTDLYDAARDENYYQRMPPASAFPPGTGRCAVHDAIIAQMLARGWSSLLILNYGVLPRSIIETSIAPLAEARLVTPDPSVTVLVGRAVSEISPHPRQIASLPGTNPRAAASTLPS